MWLDTARRRWTTWRTRKDEAASKAAMLSMEDLDVGGRRRRGDGCCCCEVLDNALNEREGGSRGGPREEDCEAYAEEDADAEEDASDELYRTYELVLRLGELVLVVICMELSVYANRQSFLFPSTYYYLLFAPMLFVLMTSFMAISVVVECYYPDYVIVSLNSFACTITGSCAGVAFDLWFFSRTSTDPAVLVYSLGSLLAACLYLFDVYLKCRSMSRLDM